MSRIPPAPASLPRTRPVTPHPHRQIHSRHVGRFPRLLLVLSVGLCCFSSACGKPAEAPQQSWEELRKTGSSTKKEDRVASWLLAELLRPGGSPKQAARARVRLDELRAEGLLASLGRGISDAGRGRAKQALEEYFAALEEASGWEDQRAPMFAWYAALRVQELQVADPDFGRRHRKAIARLLEDPGRIGFRAYAIVVDLWADDAFSEAVSDVDEKLARKLGCVEEISIAGPFGSGAAGDILNKFDAERPGVWPERFRAEETQTRPPRKLETEVSGCDVLVKEGVANGVFYAQTFLELEEDQDLIMSASGAHQLFVDDELVLNRDIRVWGVWPRFAVAVRLAKGRHRVLWKTNQDSTALRVANPSGRPAKIKASSNPSPGYSLVAPERLADPNDLMRYVRADGVLDPEDDITRFIAAYLLADEGEYDVAAVLFEPFVENAEKATGTALSTAAIFVHGDPIYDEAQTQDLVHELELRAMKHDPGLWHPRFRNIVWEAKQKGATTVVRDLEELAAEFPQVARIRFTLAELYDDLEWGPEHEQTVLRLIEDFPNDEDAIKLAIDHFESEGNSEKVDELLKELLRLNPDSELLVTRALNQKRYEDALKELRRLGARRPSRKDIAIRIERILVSSGDKQRTFEQLKQAIEREPRDAHARLALADALLAQGKDENPLGDALTAAVEAGADPSPIAGAIDLVEGLTSLEPYRIDGLKVIEEYEKSGKHLAGTAVRVLDYGAVWINRDGSTRFLEHEIVRIQSDEAIKRFTETQAQGLVLALRVIKKDGTILEPEEVLGKPTVTMPHLEIGDYIETERIVSRWGSGLGQPYSGPGWYFREQDVGYARSEFVLIAPADKDLILETHNDVPDPIVEKLGSVVVYRYRVDESPAAPAEPMSPPAQEFLPRVSVGWDLDLDRRLEEANRSLVDLTPRDPRIVRIAKKITKGKRSRQEKVRALYHWVLDSVQDGEEYDGRRVVVSRNGNRWRGFETLCRALDIPVHWALAESRLASPIAGPIGSAERPLTPLLIVGKKDHETWLTIDDKFAPFGTVPSHLRGEKAYVLGGKKPYVTTVPQAGSVDGIAYEGSGSLKKDGSATLELSIRFLGTYATSLRNGLSQIPETQLGNVIESNFLGQNLQGARLINYRVKDKDELDKPLTIEVKTEVPRFATPSNVGLLLSPPFMPRLSQLTTLAERVTPLMIGQETRQSLDLKLALPEGLSAEVQQDHGSFGQSEYHVSDTTQAGVIHLVRDVLTDAGRISVEDYPKFQTYTNQADAALSRAVRVR